MHPFRLTEMTKIILGLVGVSVLFLSNSLLPWRTSGTSALEPNASTSSARQAKGLQNPSLALPSQDPSDTRCQGIADQAMDADLEQGGQSKSTAQDLITAWKEPYRTKYHGASLPELHASRRDVVVLRNLIREDLVEEKIARGNMIIMPAGEEPEPYQIPVASNPTYPIHPTTITKKQPDGSMAATWVYIDPSRHPEYMSFMLEEAFLNGEIVAMGSHPMADSEGNVDLER